MADSEEFSEVLEGFICPMCRADLGTPTKLLSHFQDEHSEEQDLVKTFKDALDKVKKKILKQEYIADNSNNYRRTPANSFDYSYKPQEIGTITKHTDDFIRVRDEWVQRFSVPTNQIVIRLEKLLDKMPSDPLKRKVHEQDIVPWIDGTDVPRCPNCAGAFRLARRQHHCRTCGSIMCNDCSNFMSINTAKRILDKPIGEVTPQSSTEPQHLRLCTHCLTLLELREARREMKHFKPIISQFYERLSDYRKQADDLIVEYTKMSTSINKGETIYDLQEAQTIKVRLLKLAECIDTLSSKIAILGRDAEQPPQGQALKLQNMVRSAMAAYLRDQFLKLPTLPSEEEYDDIQKRRREEISARIHEEKMKQLKNEHLKSNHHYNTSKPIPQQPKVLPDQVSMGQGWVPESKKVNEAEDPIIEQMNIIRNYIKEAKAAHKLEEVESLEKNLQELKNEFLRKQQIQEEMQSRSGESSEAGSLSSYDGSKTYSESLHGDSSSH